MILTSAQRSSVITVAFVVLGLLSVSSGNAQSPGVISVFADPDGLVCSLSSSSADPFTVYVVHEFAPGTVGSQFMVASGGGFNASYVSESVFFTPSFGNTQTGIQVGYFSCIASPILVASVSYMGLAGLPACSYLEVVGDPNSSSGQIEVLLCDGQPQTTVTLGRLHVDPAPGQCTLWCVLPVEETTWGKIKSTYGGQ